MNLAQRLQNFFAGRQNKPQPVQPTESFGNKLVRGIGNSAVGKGITNLQNFIESPKPISLPQVPNRLNPSMKVGVPNTPLQLDIKPVQIVRDVVNEPLSWTANTLSDMGQNIGRSIGGRQLAQYQNLKSPATRFGYNAGSLINPTLTRELGVKNTPQQILGNAAGAIQGPLSVYGGGKVLGIGKDAASLASRRVLPVVLRREAQTGATYGGLYGLLQGLSEGRDMELPDQLLNAGVQGAVGGVAGGALGGGLGTAGYALGSAKNRLLGTLNRMGIKDRKAQEEIVSQFVRDELGRFTGVKRVPVEKPTPPGLMNNMLDDGTPTSLPQSELSRAIFSPARGRQSSLAKSRITPEMRMELRRSIGIDNAETGRISWGKGDVNTPKADIPQARPGDFSNVKEADPRIAPEFQKRNELLQEQGLEPTNLPESTPRVQDNSVISDIRQGFEGGRKAIKSDEVRNKGSLGLQLRSQLVDRLSPVYDFMKLGGKELMKGENPYKKMRLLAGRSGKAEAFLEENLSPILKREQDRLPDLSSLLVIDRERELLGRGFERKRNIEQLNQGIEELKAKYGPEGYAALERSAQEIRQVGSRMLDELKDAGIIDQNSYDTIKKNNEFYTPFEAVEHLADNIDSQGTGSFNVSSQDAIKKIGSYTGDVADPLESLVRKIPKVISLVEKNRAIQSLVKLRDTHPDVYKDLIVPVSKDSKPDGSGIINVFENGDNKRYAVPQVVESAIKNLDGETANILVNLGSIQAKMLRTGATALNIGFIPVNIIRDVQDSLTTELSENGVKAALSFIGTYPRAIFAAAKKDDLYREWMAAGGSQSTMTEQIFKGAQKTVNELAGKAPPVKTRLNPIKNTVKLIEFANRVGEQSTRLARFQSGLKKGETLDQAAFKSRDISLDFAKAGNSIKVLNQVIPFLNASIQGSEKLMRLYKTNPTAAIASTGVLFGVPTVALFTHNSQFKDYDDIPDAEKQTNWIILARDRTEEERAAGDSPIGIKIPKGFMGRMVSTTAESAMDFMKKRDPSTFLNAAVDTVESVSPVGLPVGDRMGKTLSTILPPWLRAAYEWNSNTNTFFGSDIVPQSLQNLPASEQYKEKTPGVYKLAGKLTGLSPLKIENTVNTTTGGLGRQIATLASGDLEGGTVKQISRRFMDIRDGKKTEEAYDAVRKEKEYTALRNKQLKEAFRDGDMEEVKRLSEGMSSQQIKSLIRNDAKKELKAKLTPEQKAYETLSKEERRRLEATRPELKTELDILPKTEAAENTPNNYDFAKEVASDVEEAAIKLEVETTGKPQFFNNTYYYINEKGNPATIDANMRPEEPELTGDPVLDKELKKDYQSDISTKQNNVLKLLKQKAITKEKAADLWTRLEEKRSMSGGKYATGSGKGRKTAKIDFRQFAKAISVKPMQVRVSRKTKGARVVPPKVSTPKIRELKFKGRPIQLKRKK